MTPIVLTNNKRARAVTEPFVILDIAGCTKTHCHGPKGNCRYLWGDQEGGDCRVFFSDESGEGWSLKRDEIGALRSPACIENEKWTAEVRRLARELLVLHESTESVSYPGDTTGMSAKRRRLGL